MVLEYKLITIINTIQIFFYTPVMLETYWVGTMNKKKGIAPL